MAAIAALAKRATVVVILFMAAHAIGIGSRELIADVATLAGHHIVKAD